MANVYVVIPKTAKCRNWIKENTGEDSIWYAGGIAVEWRYTEDFMQGLEENGFYLNKHFTIIS